MIEPFSPFIEGLLRSEPWRAGQGDTASLCPGGLSFDGSRHWLCDGCGRIGLLPTTQHFPLRPSPVRTFVRQFMQALEATPLAPLA